MIFHWAYDNYVNSIGIESCIVSSKEALMQRLYFIRTTQSWKHGKPWNVSFEKYPRMSWKKSCHLKITPECHGKVRMEKVMSFENHPWISWKTENGKSHGILLAPRLQIIKWMAHGLNTILILNTIFIFWHVQMIVIIILL